MPALQRHKRSLASQNRSQSPLCLCMAPPNFTTQYSGYRRGELPHDLSLWPVDWFKSHPRATASFCCPPERVGVGAPTLRADPRTCCAYQGGQFGGKTSFASKWLVMLKALAPQLARVALVFGPDNPSAAGYRKVLESTPPSFGIKMIPKMP